MNPYSILSCFIFQLFARRTKYVPQKPRKNWDRLNMHYISEEEDANEVKGQILVKKLPWRSDSGCTLLNIIIIMR